MWYTHTRTLPLFPDLWVLYAGQDSPLPFMCSVMHTQWQESHYVLAEPCLPAVLPTLPVSASSLHLCAVSIPLSSQTTEPGL